jgi:hypothetical protein
MYATATKMAMKEGIELDEAKLDELGLGTLFSYGMKRLGQAMKGNLPPKKSPEVHAKNLERASDKLSDKKYVQTPVPKDNVVPLKKEEVELDEASNTSDKIKKMYDDAMKHPAGSGARKAAIQQYQKARQDMRDMKKMKKEEVELDEISAETKASYKKKAGEEVKQLQPHAKKGEYKDLAKSLIAKRKKGMEKADK